MANRKHPWNKIDPILLERKVSMAEVARKWKIPYRQVTNRYYAIRNKLAKKTASGTPRK